MVKKNKSHASNHTQITVKLATRFEKILSSLPDDQYLDLAWSDALRERWWEHRSACTTIGKCFAARFTGADDPISHLKESDDDWTRLSHAHTWRMVDYYEILWGLTQVTWDYVKQALLYLKLSCPFKRAWDFFVAMISQSENEIYEKFLLHEFKEHSAKDQEKICFLAAKAIRERVNPLEIPGLTRKERDLLSRIKKNTTTGDSHLYAILLATAETVQRSDHYIRDKYRAFQLIVSDEADALGKLYADSRKGRVNAETRAEHWIDGTLYRKDKKKPVICNKIS